MRAAGSGGAGAGKFPPRPGPAFVVRRGERARPRAHRGTGVLLLLRRNVAKEGEENKGERLTPSLVISHLSPTSQLRGGFEGSPRQQPAPSLRPQTGPGFSQPFWGGGSLRWWLGQARRVGGSAPGSSERATKCCPAFRAANNVLS